MNRFIMLANQRRRIMENTKPNTKPDNGDQDQNNGGKPVQR